MLFITDLKPVACPISKEIKQSVFLVKSIEIEADYYHTYRLLNEESQQLTFMRCFGSCLNFLVGERWLLSYERYSRKGSPCFSIICRYSAGNSVSATLVRNKDNHRISAAEGDSDHEKYIELLAMWFEKKTTVAIFSALALNDKRFFTKEIFQVFKKTGTSHLVAMSGLHVGLMVGLVCRLLIGMIAFFSPGFSSKHIIIIRWIVVLIVGVFIFFGVNASYSIQRSLFMYELSSVVIFFRFHLSLKSLLKYTAVILVLLDPEIVLSVGGWLSFFTVFILAHYSGKFADVDNLWFGGCITHFLIFVFLCPVSLYFFHSLSLLSPIVNVIAIPWFSLTVIPLLVLSLLSSSFSLVIAKLFALLASCFFEPIYTLLSWVSGLPHTQFHVNYFSFPFLVISLLLLFALTGLARQYWLPRRSVAF
jgi:ComEC/Rec2-related protein